MKFCPECGYKNADENKFCRGCGKKFEAETDNPQSQSNKNTPGIVGLIIIVLASLSIIVGLVAVISGTSDLKLTHLGAVLSMILCAVIFFYRLFGSKN